MTVHNSSLKERGMERTDARAFRPSISGAAVHDDVTSAVAHGSSHDRFVGYVCYYVVVGHRSSDGHSLLFHFLCCTTVAVAVVSVGICCVFLWLRAIAVAMVVVWFSFLVKAGRLRVLQRAELTLAQRNYLTYRVFWPVWSLWLGLGSVGLVWLGSLGTLGFGWPGAMKTAKTHQKPII